MLGPEQRPETSGAEAEQLTFLDPEAGINRMHYRKRLSKIHVRDINYQRRMVLKNLGITDANIRRLLEQNFYEAKLRLQGAGVWPLVLKKDLTIDEQRLIRKVFNELPQRDYDSSEGVAIYPTEDSWHWDTRGRFELEGD